MALVGKGLTFDSGGYNLKVGAGSMIELMKFDMGGCAAVLGCAKAIAQLRPKVSMSHRKLPIVAFILIRSSELVRLSYSVKAIYLLKR